jgi:hypothetical protein
MSSFFPFCAWLGVICWDHVSQHRQVHHFIWYLLLCMVLFSNNKCTKVGFEFRGSPTLRNLCIVKTKAIRFIRKVGLSLGLLSPPSLSGICKVMKFLLNLSMKCWNSAFIAQGSRVIIVVVEVVEVVKIYVAGLKALRGLRKEGMKLSLPPKLVEKLVWVPVISFCKYCHSQLHIWCPIMLKLAVLAPLIMWTLGITLLFQQLLTWKNIHGVKIKAIVFWWSLY